MNAPEVWVTDPEPGGYVCGAPSPPDQPGVQHAGQRICGHPTESDPCPIHRECDPR